MKQPRVCCARFAPLIFLFVAGLACTRHVTAQQPSTSAKIDFQIMVNGPWAYVVDPNPGNDPNPNADKRKRVVLVAPASSSSDHQAFVFEGLDARFSGISPNCVKGASIGAGLYYLDLDSRTSAGVRGSGDGRPVVYRISQSMGASKIRSNIYQATDRVAISLPTPDFYSTYAGPYGVGTAESKMAPGNITPSTPAKDYTIWMVLHYQVTRPVTAVAWSLRGPTTPGCNPIGTAKDNGISLLMAAPYAMSAPYCDTLSLESFAQFKKLWGFSDHVRFPEEADPVGTQKRGVYHYECPEGAANFSALEMDFRHAQDSSQETLVKIEKLGTSLGSEDSKRRLAAEQQPDGEPKSLVETRPTGARERPSVDEDPKDNFGDLKNAVSKLSFGVIPATVQKDLDCLDELVRDPQNNGRACGRDQPRGLLVDAVLKNMTSAVSMMAMGSTDCHLAQMSINGAVP